MRTGFHTLLLLGASVASTLAMNAQASTEATRHEVDLAVLYSAQRSRLASGENFWRQGGSLELSATMTHGLGVTMNLGGSHVTNIDGTGVNLTTITTTFGPRYTWTPRSRKIAIFGQGLIGESHGTDGIFPAPQGAVSDFNTFAVQVGGGVDFRVKHHFALRPIQAEWLRTQYPNGASNVQNDFRLSAGIVFRLQR